MATNLVGYHEYVWIVTNAYKLERKKGIGEKRNRKCSTFPVSPSCRARWYWKPRCVLAVTSTCRTLSILKYSYLTSTMRSVVPICSTEHSWNNRFMRFVRIVCLYEFYSPGFLELHRFYLRNYIMPIAQDDCLINPRLKIGLAFQGFEYQWIYSTDGSIFLIYY